MSVTDPKRTCSEQLTTRPRIIWFPPLDVSRHSRFRLEFEGRGCQSLARRKHGDRMKRRRFQKMLFFAGITASPLIGVRAQPKPKPKLRIGCASIGESRNDRATGFTALFERLAELGYVEGRNLEVDFVLTTNIPNFLAPYNAFVRR